MLLRSGRATIYTGPHRPIYGSTSACGFDAAAAAGHPDLKRKACFEDQATPRHQIRRKSNSPPALPLAAVSALDATNNEDDEESLAKLGVKLLPEFPPETAAHVWVRYVRNVKACINHYNNTHQETSFVYKHDPDTDGSILVGQQDGSRYFHVNFFAQDKNGHSQLFFGEIRVGVTPKEDDVTCCCHVSPSDAGGKCIRTIEEALKFKFPTLGTAGMDQEHCYACPSRVKHPKGTVYVAGHYADSRQYYMFLE